MRILNILFLIFFIGAFLFGQAPGEITKEMVSAEETFANAQREMLVGKNDKAIELFESLYKADRTNAAVAFELFKSYQQKKDDLQMDRFSKVVLQYAPANKWMIDYIAKHYFDVKNYTTALDYYQRLATIESSNQRYIDRIADCKVNAQKYEEAISSYISFEQKNGTNPNISLRKYELYKLAKNNSLALKEINQLIAKYPNEKKYLKVKILHLMEEGKNTETTDLYRKILAIDPTDTEANLAVLSKGDNKEKPNAYLMSLLPIITNQSIDIDSKIKEIMPYVQNMAHGGGNDEQKVALREIGNKLVLTHPTESKAYALYGDILLNTGNLEEAISKYEKTISLNSKNFAVWEQLMYAYVEVENYGDLQKLSEKAIDLYPNQALPFYFSALAKVKANKLSDAQSDIDEGILVSGGNKSIKSRLLTAQALAQIAAKQYDQAQKSIDESLALSDNKNSISYEVQGDLFASKGDMQKAKENWKKSITFGNTSKRVLTKSM